MNISPAERLESEFEAMGHKRNGILLLSAGQSRDLIKRAEACGIVVWGIDSFLLEGKALQPLMEESIDFSISNQAIDDHWEESIAFIDHRKDRGFLFEVVLGNRKADGPDIAATP